MMKSVSSSPQSSPRRHLHAVSAFTSDPSSHLIHHPSHHKRTLPLPRSVTHTPRHRSFVLVLLLTCFVALSSAGRISLSEQMLASSRSADHRNADSDLRSALDRLAHTGTIIVDNSLPPNPAAWMLASEHEALMRRADDKNKTTSGNATKPSATNSAVVTAATQGPVALPTPFDSGYSSNLTQSCSDFMSGFLSTAQFKACLPMSLLLQNSQSFFQTSKSLVRISQTLDATCSANVTSCTTLTFQLATNLTASTNCASDYASHNPLIEQAYSGLLAYRVMYTATCLRNPRTSSYCYADAITNTTNPSDPYIYYLPLNTTLPGGTQPTCDSCVQETMNVFAAATSDRKSAIADTYAAAAMQVNVQCGPGFVNQSLAAAVVGSSAMGMPAVSTGALALVMLLMGCLL